MKYTDLRGAGEVKSSASVRERALRARQIQQDGYKGEKSTYANSPMPQVDPQALRYLRRRLNSS